jgi:hypothetical protein
VYLHSASALRSDKLYHRFHRLSVRHPVALSCVPGDNDVASIYPPGLPTTRSDESITELIEPHEVAAVQKSLAHMSMPRRGGELDRPRDATRAANVKAGEANVKAGRRQSPAAPAAGGWLEGALPPIDRPGRGRSPAVARTGGVCRRSFVHG